MLYFVKLENNGSYKKYCLTTFVSIHQQQVWYACGEKKTKKHFRKYSTNIALISHKGFGTDGRQIINQLVN